MNPEMMLDLAADRIGRMRREADDFRLVRQASRGRHRRLFRWPGLRRAGASIRHRLAS